MPMRVQNLRCEYQTDPIGIDVLQPRLSWQLLPDHAEQRDLVQTVYQIQVAGDPQTLETGRDLLWDSGQVLSERSVHEIVTRSSSSSSVASIETGAAIRREPLSAVALDSTPRAVTAATEYSIALPAGPPSSE